MPVNTTALIMLEEDAVMGGGESTFAMDDQYDSNYSVYQDIMCQDTYNSANSTMEMLPKLTRFVVYGILLTTVGLLGLCGNLISITILSRPKMRSSINCCLIGLTSFDLIVVTTSILMFGLPEISEYTQTLSWYNKGVFPRVTPFVFPLALIAQTGSVYLTVTVTVERYIAVCRPLRARSICTYGRAKVYVMSVALFSVLYNLPRFWEITYKGAALALQGVHHVHGCHRLPLGVLGVRHSVADLVLKEHLQHAAGLLVDQARDTLHTTTAGKTTDRYRR